VFIAISVYLKPLEEVDRFYPEHFAWLEGHSASARNPPSTLFLRDPQKGSKWN
jgi:uncharacterized protein YciI